MFSGVTHEQMQSLALIKCRIRDQWIGSFCIIPNKLHRHQILNEEEKSRELLIRFCSQQRRDRTENEARILQNVHILWSGKAFNANALHIAAFQHC